MARTKILYVEDEPFLGRIVKESLESRDFEVIMVTDGKNAMESFQQNQPHICVLDIMLPEKMVMPSRVRFECIASNADHFCNGQSADRGSH